ncbi:hypothetical protein I7I48_01935 [Histoplasma ohiense]|nr:hypothetical protein I7I48_01935 [Histoplasma ohiense (nom. inval.)]
MGFLVTFTPAKLNAFHLQTAPATFTLSLWQLFSYQLFRDIKALRECIAAKNGAMAGFHSDLPQLTFSHPPPQREISHSSPFLLVTDHFSYPLRNQC